MNHIFKNILQPKIYSFVTFSGYVFKRIYDPNLVSSYKEKLHQDGFIENHDYYVREKTLND